MDYVTPWLKQFRRTEEGHVYYPSAKTGGKFISAEEYELLLADWKRVSKLFSIMNVVIGSLVLVTLSILLVLTLDLPLWTFTVILVAPVTFMTAYILWVGTAPARLVKYRPEITAPRPASDVREEARAAMGWPLITLILFGSAAYLVSSLTSFDGTLRSTIWIVASGGLFLGYLSIATLKIMDRRS